MPHLSEEFTVWLEKELLQKCQEKAFCHIASEMQVAMYSSPPDTLPPPPFLLVIHSASSLVNIDITPLIITERSPGGRGFLQVLENKIMQYTEGRK